MYHSPRLKPKFLLKLNSCESIALLFPTLQLTCLCCIQSFSSDPRSNPISCCVLCCFLCSQGTSLILPFFSRSTFNWIFAMRSEWEALCFTDLQCLSKHCPSVKPRSLSSILKKKNNKTTNKSPGCIWKRLHSFKSNKKFIQLLKSTLDEVLSYRFLLVSACV